jgi:tetratricopeptide (TPR) repeat protein
VSGSGTYGCSHGIGDVVKLEIEKDRVAAGSQGLKDCRTSGGKKLEAHLEPVAMAFQLMDKLEGSSRGRRIQRDDETAAGVIKRSRWFCRRRFVAIKTGVEPFRGRHNEIVKHTLAETVRGKVGRSKAALNNTGLDPYAKPFHFVAALLPGGAAGSRFDPPAGSSTKHKTGAEKGDSGLRKASLGMPALILGLALAFAGRIAWGADITTNPMNYDPPVQKAFAEFHELNFAEAVPDFQRYHEEHPGDPQATAYLLNAEVFQELYRLDLLDTTFYANDGFLSGRHATVEDPAARARILSLANEVVSEANWRLSQNPRDVNALFARGWARSLECTYIAMVERGFSSAFHLASKAKDDEVRVLQIDPEYADAKLIVGVYNYVVGALPWPFKLIIGIAGITGSKSKGMQMLREAGQHGVITSAEARTVMALFLRREGKYKQAIQIVRGLEAQYPHDFLFQLEEANLRKDDGEGMTAVMAYQQVIEEARQPGYFPSAKLELADFGLGEALRGQRRYQRAAQAYEHAAETQDVGAELKIRSLVAGGECRDMADERKLAIEDYRGAIAAGPNTTRADAARRYLRSPFRGS